MTQISAAGGSIIIHGRDMSYRIDEHLLDDQASQPLPMLQLPVQLLQVDMPDPVNNGRFQRLYASGGRLLWQKALIITYKSPFLAEIIRFLLVVGMSVIAYKTAFDKTNITAGGSGFQEVLTLPEGLSFEQPLNNLLIIG